MGDTPKIRKNRNRTSLSLNKKLNQRLSSPQRRRRSIEQGNENQDSPVADENECTPPHKKFSLDSTLDFSPTSFEGCHSPSDLLSQSIGPEERDVDWCWTKYEDKLTTGKKNFKNDRDPASDEGTPTTIRRTRSESYRSRQAYLKKVNELRHAREIEIYRAEKAKAELHLRQRILELGEKFKIVTDDKDEIENQKEQKEQTVPDVENIFSELEDDLDFEDGITDKPCHNESTTLESFKQAIEKHSPDKVELLDDFFNDSEIDNFLLEATQQIEATIPELTQKLTAPVSLPIVDRSVNKTNQIVRTKTETFTSTTVVTTPKNTDKQSSLYMQFLEDDDDFFVSLDEDWLMKATQANKPRSPFTRYKSMPASTTTAATASPSSKASKHISNKSGNTSRGSSTKNDLRETRSSTAASNALKRHASSHALSPSNTNLRGRQLHRRD